MKEIRKKKSIIMILILICVGIIAVIAGFVVRDGQKQREIQEHLELADKFLDELDYEQAIAECTAVLEIDPKNQEAVKLLALAREGKEKQDEKQKEIQGYLVEAEQYLEKERYGPAIEQYMAAMEADPDEPKYQELLENTYLEYARSCMEAGNYQGAEELLDRGYQTIPTDTFLIRIEEMEKEIEEARKMAQEQARREAEEKKRQDWEKPKNIYQWLIERLGLITKFPWTFTQKEDDESYIYHVYFGRDNVDGTFDEYYEVHVNKGTEEAEIVRHLTYDNKIGEWNESRRNVGKKYDFKITAEIKEEYLDCCEKRDAFEQYIDRLDAYLMAEWSYGKERGYHLMMQNLEMPEEGQNIWSGEVFYYDSGYGNLSMSVEVNIADETAKIIGLTLDPGDKSSDTLKDIIGTNISVKQTDTK